MTYGLFRSFQCEMSLWEFRQLLALRRITPYYDETELQEDLNRLREL